MPRGNGTGPNGAGAMTGRSAGFCAGYDAPGYASIHQKGRSGGFWCGRGGFGRGRGYRHQFHTTGVPGWRRNNWGGTGVPMPVNVERTEEQTLQNLKDQQAFLEDSLADVKRQVDEVSQAMEKKS